MAKIAEHGRLLNRAQHLSYCCGQFIPRFLAGIELAAAGSCELVVFGATVIIRRAPMGLDQAAALEPVQGRIQGALLDAQHIARHLLYAFGDGPAVLRTKGDCSEDEQIQRPLWKIDILRQDAISPFTSTSSTTRCRSARGND